MGKKELSKYIRGCLDSGYSFKQIEGALVKRGYTTRAAEGILLSYKHRGNMLKWLTVSSLAVLFIVAVFLSGSGLVGMVTLDFAKSYDDNIQLIVNTSSYYTWYPPDKGEIVSIAITGNIIGEGDASVYIENKQKYLIFDSKLENYKVTNVKSALLGNNIKHFEIVCEETCDLLGFNKSVYNLVFEVEDSVIEIEKISYDVKASKEVEKIPQFLDIPKQEIGVSSELKIDLNTFFNSSDKASYDYIAEDEIIAVVIEENIATVKPNIAATAHLYFLAVVDGIQFISNLVEIEITDAKTGNVFVDGPFYGEVLDQEKVSPKPYAALLLLVSLLVIIILALVPGKYYDIRNLARKIDNLRKTRQLSSSLNEYNALKSKLKKSESDEEKDNIMNQMENHIKDISGKVPRIKLMKEFDKKCKDFESKKNMEAKEKAYSDLREVYVKLLETNIHNKDKEKLYAKMEEYYRMLK
jgi:hypothetical protein